MNERDIFEVICSDFRKEGNEKLWGQLSKYPCSSLNGTIYRILHIGLFTGKGKGKPGACVEVQ